MLATRAKMAASNTGVSTYATILQNDYSASEVWPLVNIASGTNIGAFINASRDGTLSGWALQNGAGPVTGTLAPSSDGVNDYGNIYTSGGGVGLADIWSGTEGSLFAWAKVSGAGVWTDSTQRRVVDIRASGSNFVILFKPTTSNQVNGIYRANGVTQQLVKVLFSPSDWFSIGISWSKTSDEVKFFVNGTQEGGTATGLGTWAGALDSGSCAIGSSFTTTPLFVWDGLLGYVALKAGGVWSPTDFTNMHNAASTAAAD